MEAPMAHASEDGLPRQARAVQEEHHPDEDLGRPTQGDGRLSPRRQHRGGDHLRRSAPPPRRQQLRLAPKSANGGVRFRYRADRPGEIDFEWARNDAFTEGVRYDDSPCVAAPGRVCADRGRRLEGYYSHYRIGF